MSEKYVYFFEFQHLPVCTLKYFSANMHWYHNIVQVGVQIREGDRCHFQANQYTGKQQI